MVIKINLQNVVTVVLIAVDLSNVSATTLPVLLLNFPLNHLIRPMWPICLSSLLKMI